MYDVHKQAYRQANDQRLDAITNALMERLKEVTGRAPRDEQRTWEKLREAIEYEI